MRKLLAALFVVVVGCGSDAPTPPKSTDTHEALAAESVEVLAEYLGVLEKVTDEATAAELRPQILDYKRRLGELTRRKEALGPMTEEQQQALLEKYGERMEELGRLQGQFGQRVSSDPGIRKGLSDPVSNGNKSD